MQPIIDFIGPTLLILTKGFDGVHRIGVCGMGQEGTMLNGEAAALIQTRAHAVAGYAPPQWLIDLKATAGEMRQGRERPAGKPFGRWLGDFLDQDTPSGLLPAEEKFLFAAVDGEPCVLESRAAVLWAALDEWRDHMPEAPPEEAGFVEAIAKFTEAAPEHVQEVIIEATRHAIEELRLPAYWEPKNAGDVERFALAQRAFLARLEAEAHPPQTVEHARKDERFYHLAVEAVVESATPKPYEPLKLNHEWLNPLLRRDPFNLSAQTRAKIDTYPRVLRGFFDDLLREVNRAAREQNFADSLKADPGALREHFDTVFARYEREHWRWVDPEDPEVQVRASFLRFLSLGGDDFAPVHESRLELHGAYVDEDLDLSGCTIPQPLLFFRCSFAAQILLKDAVTRSLLFPTCRVQSIDADGADIRGAVNLQGGFRSDGGVSLTHSAIEGRLWCEGSAFFSTGNFALNCAGTRIRGNVLLLDGFLGEGGVFFRGAKIDGDMNCAGGTFRNPKEDGSGVALSCDSAEIRGYVVLSAGFRSEGSVSFAGSKVGGGLNCIEGTFLNRIQNGTGKALNFALAEIEGSVALGDGLSAEGEACFNGTHVKGNLLCSGGRFNNPARQKFNGSSECIPALAYALNFADARIDGILCLGPDAKDADAPAEIAGSVNLAGCHAHEIVDHSASWPAKKSQLLAARQFARLFFWMASLTIV